MTTKTKDRQEDIAYRALAPKDFMGFVEGLLIPSATGPQMFGDCMEGFQERTFCDLAPSLHAIRDGVKPPKRRFWLERTKKAGKDSDLAACLLWLLAFPTRPIYIQVGAGDKDQAAIVRKRIVNLLYYNPWLEKFVRVDQWKISHLGNLATIDILAADPKGTHGGLPDLLVIDELSHVDKWEYVEALLNNAMGVPQGMVIIATNAGFKGSKVEVLQKLAIEKWSCHFWRQPSPWLNDEDIEEAKRINNKSEFDRLFWGKWSSGGGDALDPMDIDRCFKAGLGPLSSPEPGWTYIAGLDLGVSHDHSGFLVLGINFETRRFRVAYLQGWAPSPITKKIDLMQVKETILAVSKKFGVQWTGCDMYEAEFMSQQLEQEGIYFEKVNFGGISSQEMAMSLKSVLESGMLDAYDDFEGRLKRDLQKFNIVANPKTGYYKIDSLRDEHGHADVGTALLICLPHAIKLLGGLGMHRPVKDEDWEFDDSPLTEKEIKAMPDELREIYEDQDQVDKDWAAMTSSDDEFDDVL